MVKPFFLFLSSHFVDDNIFDFLADFRERPDSRRAAVFAVEDKDFLSGGNGLAVLARLEGEDGFTQIVAEVRSIDPSPIPALAASAVLTVFSGEFGKVLSLFQLADEVVGGLHEEVDTLFCVGCQADETQVNAFFLEEALTIFPVIGFYSNGAENGAAFPLLLEHDLDNDFLTEFFPVFPDVHALGFQVIQKAATVITEVFDKDVVEAVFDKGGWHLIAFVLEFDLKLLEDKDPVHNVLDNFAFKAFQPLLKLLGIAGLAADLGNQGRHIPLHFIPGDNPVFNDRGNSIFDG